MPDVSKGICMSCKKTVPVVFSPCDPELATMLADYYKTADHEDRAGTICRGSGRVPEDVFEDDAEDDLRDLFEDCALSEDECEALRLPYPNV